DVSTVADEIVVPMFKAKPRVQVTLQHCTVAYAFHAGSDWERRSQLLPPLPTAAQQQQQLKVITSRDLQSFVELKLVDICMIANLINTTAATVVDSSAAMRQHERIIRLFFSVGDIQLLDRVRHSRFDKIIAFDTTPTSKVVII